MPGQFERRLGKQVAHRAVLIADVGDRQDRRAFSKTERVDERGEKVGNLIRVARRTAATGMAKAGVPPHVVERLLNHVSGTFGGVAGVYNCFGYLDKMRQALVAWEGLVEKASTMPDAALSATKPS